MGAAWPVAVGVQRNDVRRLIVVLSDLFLFSPETD